MSSAVSAAPGRTVPLELTADYRNRWLIAITVTLASILELIDTSIVNVAIPHMMGSLGATLDEIAWVSTGYIVANVVILPISSWLASAIGRRRYFAGSIAVFTIASFLCGSAHTLPELVVWRIVQGLGGGALLTTSQAVLYEVFPPREYAAAMAIYGVGIMVGPTLGPTLGGWITDTLSWPWIFYINLPFGAMAFAMSLAFIGDSRFARRIQRVDWPGLALLVVAVGTLQTMLERGEKQDWFASREIVAYGVTCLVSTVAFFWRELTTDHPVVDLRIFKNPTFAAGILFAGALGACLYATVFVFPVYLQGLLGFTANQTGLVILPGAIASAVTMAAMARMRGRVDPRRLVTVGVVLFSIAMVQWSHFTTLSGIDDFWWPLVLRGVGLGLVFVPLNNVTISGLPMHKIAEGTGLFGLARQLGGSIGIALGATLVPRLASQAREALIEHVTAYDPVAVARLDGLKAAMVARGTLPAIAESRALAVLNAQVARQASMLAFERVFFMFGLAFLLALPLLLFMKWRRPTTTEAAPAAH